MAKPAVVLVGADKGGVGKTTVARALIDYLTAQGIPTRAFDTENPRGTLRRFYPDLTEVIDITATADQMKVFDTISSTDARITLIDVRAGSMLATLRSLRDIGLIEAAKKEQLSFALLHVLGPSLASLDEIAETAAIIPDTHHVLVKNFINNTSFFEWNLTTHDAYFKGHGGHTITVPKLNEMAYEQVEVAGVPFVSFIANKAQDGQPACHSFVLRGYVRHWLGSVWSEFDRIKLNDIVAADLAHRTAPAAVRQA